MRRSKWISNPHFNGTYTFPTTKSNFPEDINILAEPLVFKGEPRVCFAGALIQFSFFQQIPLIFFYKKKVD